MTNSFFKSSPISVTRSLGLRCVTVRQPASSRAAYAAYVIQVGYRLRPPAVHGRPCC